MHSFAKAPNVYRKQFISATEEAIYRSAKLVNILLAGSCE